MIDYLLAPASPLLRMILAFGSVGCMLAMVVTLVVLGRHK